MQSIKEFANSITGRNGNELTPEECTLAKENNWLVVFGYSDDNAELRGFVHDEVSCYDGGEFSVDSIGLKEPWEDGERLTYEAAKQFFERDQNETINVSIEWHDGGDCRWTYEVTGAESVEFDVLDPDSDDLFSKGVVIDCNGLLASEGWS